MTQAARTRKRGHALALAGVWFAVAAWGASFVAARLLLHATAPRQTALSPTVLAAARFSIASLFFLVPLARAVARRQVSGRDLLLMALLGQLAFSLYFWLQYTGVQRTNASTASILVVGLIPLATLVLSQRLGQEQPRLETFGAFLLGFLGVALVVLRGGVLVSPDPGFLVGALCLVGDAFAFAAYATLSKRWMRALSPLVVTGGTMVSGACGLLLLSLLDAPQQRWSDLARLDARQWAALLYLALICSVAAYFAYNVALSRLAASRAALALYVEPVVAVLLGVSLLGERLSWQTLAGAAAIGLSVAIVTLASGARLQREVRHDHEQNGQHQRERGRAYHQAEAETSAQLRAAREVVEDRADEGHTDQEHAPAQACAARQILPLRQLDEADREPRGVQGEEQQITVEREQDLDDGVRGEPEREQHGGPS
jgi:drug/metabolite transporter (DMT)-like permease